MTKPTMLTVIPVLLSLDIPATVHFYYYFTPMLLPCVSQNG